MRSVRVACAVIADASGCLLATRRAPGRSQGGLWEFPGGKLEPGESAPAALAREIREELELEIEVGAALSPVRHAYPDLLVELLPYHCRIRSGTLRLRDHDEARWLRQGELPGLDWAPADLPIVAALSAAGSLPTEGAAIPRSPEPPQGAT